MRHPRDYAVNEAWIVFRLNDAPVRTEQDGDFHVVCLMDAASCFILGNEFVPTTASGVPATVAEALIDKGSGVANVLPRKLLLSSALGTARFARLAKRAGIELERVPDKDMRAFVSEARRSFQEWTARQP